MKVKELISKLQKFDENLRVLDGYMQEIEDIEERTWVDSNYPYDRPDEQVVVLE